MMRSDTKFIERLAVEYSQILSLLQQGKDLALTPTLIPVWISNRMF